MSDASDLYHKLIDGDRVALARAITLVESYNEAHRAAAAELLDLCADRKPSTFRFTVSGAPGAGKSTFIETLGQYIVAHGDRLAVLAIDPTSRISRGAILADKTRMQKLSHHPGVFVRPSAAGESLGGVADRTREAIVICEAAGYSTICLETVGVGQSEVTAASMTDFFLLLVLPGGGDDLQGMKRGIVEMADMIAITKADGSGLTLARETQRSYLQALHLYGAKPHAQTVNVVTCSAAEDKGIREIWDLMITFSQETEASGYRDQHRTEQDLIWLDTRIGQLARDIVLSSGNISSGYTELRQRVGKRELSATSALRQIESMMAKTISGS